MLAGVRVRGLDVLGGLDQWDAAGLTGLPQDEPMNEVLGSRRRPSERAQAYRGARILSQRPRAIPGFGALQ